MKRAIISSCMQHENNCQAGNLRPGEELPKKKNWGARRTFQGLKSGLVHLKLLSLKPSTAGAFDLLSPGQTDRQVVASGRKLNLSRDLRWVAKRLASFFASTRKSQKKTF